MEFINLFKALETIANHVDLGPHLDDKATHIGSISRDAADRFWQENNPKIEHARGVAYASLLLNKALHDSNTPPQWMMFEEEKRFEVRSETAKQLGLEMLTYATSWGNRRLRNYSTHFHNSITQGDSALALEVVHVDCDDIVPREKLLQFVRLGFDCAELAAFLDSNQITHDLKPETTIANARPIKASSTSSELNWVLNKPQRYRGYRAPLYHFLAEARNKGLPRPTARDVVEAWRIEKPAEIESVQTDGLKYYDSKGDVQAIDLEAIRRSIGRLVSAP